MFKFGIGFIFFVFLLGSVSKAESKQPPFKIKYLGIEKGLSNNAVTSIYQDRRGFMWFGTYDGLNRYDGYDFKVFRNQPNDSTTLINNRIVSIYETGDQLWIGTKKGVSAYEYLNGYFTTHTFLDYQTSEYQAIDCSINQIAGAEDTVFVATGGKGLLYKQPQESFFRRFPLLSGGDKIWDFHAQTVELDRLGNLWVFVQGYGIYQLNRQSQVLELASTLTNHANCIISDSNADLWIGTDSGLLFYSPDDKRRIVFPAQITKHKVTDLLYVEEQEEIWFATDGNGVGVYEIENDTFRTLKEGAQSTDLTSNSVYALFQDDSGRQWIGTLRGGVNIVESDHFQFWTIARNSEAEEGLVSNFILSFSGYGEDQVWIGTDGGGVSLWDRKKNNFKKFTHSSADPKSLPNNFVTAILDDEAGVWFATYGGGVSKYIEQTNEFEPYPLFNIKNGYNQANIWVLFKDSQKFLWAATSDGEGLYRYDAVLDKFEFIDAGISGIISMAEDAEGNLWAGTFDQLIKMDLTTFQHSVFEIDYPVRDIEFVSDKKMLLGTEGSGLIELHAAEGIERVLTEKDGLSNNSVLNILKDDNGLYWLSTYNGITKFDIKSRSFVNYYGSDGLQSNQFNYNAALKLSSGELMFGGIKGFNVIAPNSSEALNGHPDLLITNIKINNVPIEQSGKTAFSQNKLELPYEKSMLTIDFVALEYASQDKISYAYYLEGWDRDWHYVGSSRVANYSKLDEGDYVFKIKSTNAEGVWSNEATTLTITILPPWYRTVWAYIAYFLVSVLVLYGISIYQRRQARLTYQVKLSQDLAQKEKELNEKKLSFFTNISHEFRSPLTMIINPLKEAIYGQKQGMDQGEIEVVYRNSKRLLSLVDQLLLFRKAESDIGELRIVKVDLVALSREVFSCFVHHAKTKHIAYTWSSSLDNCIVYADKQKVEISLFNLIANAVRFSGKDNGKVEVCLKNANGEAVLSVSDNGSGIADTEKEKVFELFYQSENDNRSHKNGFGIGLYLVDKFVQIHSGKVICADNPLGGTIFSIYLPQGKEHLHGVLIREELHEHAVFLEELIGEDGVSEEASSDLEDPISGELIEDSKTILIVDDNLQIRKYISSIFSQLYKILEASDAEEAMEILQTQQPDLILSDVVMGEMSGVEFCKIVKSDSHLKHIPIVLLTGSSSEEIKITGVEAGADDYITKPFDKEYLLARVRGILKQKETLKDHLFDTVTQKRSNLKLSEEDKRFVDAIISVIESYLEDREFNIKILSEDMGMSHSLLYRKVKQITGKSLNELIRFTRLRKVAGLLINSEMQINEAAYAAGFSDIKYFRKQFQQVYEMNPSDFQKKYKSALVDKHFTLNEKFWKIS